MDFFKKLFIQLWELYRLEVILIAMSSTMGLLSFFFFIQNQSAPKASIHITNPSPPATRAISVHIDGAVVKPGVYEFPARTRLHEVLARAQGIRQDADSAAVAKNINLSKYVEDQEKIYIPFKQSFDQQQELEKTNNDEDLISINTATSAELETLPGIGPTAAARIIEGRPYSSIDTLIKQKIIYQTVFEKIKNSISL